MNDVIRF